MNKRIKQWIKPVILCCIFASLIIIYRFFDPQSSGVFPVCPFKKYTGLLCPGCGSQRAIHDLLNLNLLEAFKENSMVVLALPYLITGTIFDFLKNPNKRILKWRKMLFGKTAIYIILIIIIAFWIVRNINFI